MSYSKERIEIGNSYRDLIKAGIKIDENTFINWACSLYDIDYATAKNGLTDGINLLALEKKAEMAQVVDEDKVLNDLVQNLDNKLEPKEQEIKEVFTNE